MGCLWVVMGVAEVTMMHMIYMIYNVIICQLYVNYRQLILGLYPLYTTKIPTTISQRTTGTPCTYSTLNPKDQLVSLDQRDHAYGGINNHHVHSTDRVPSVLLL